MFAIASKNYRPMPSLPVLIEHIWQTACKIWCSSALFNVLFYTVVFAIGEGSDGILFGVLVGLISAIISLPAIVLLHSVLPWLLNIKHRIQRISSISGVIVFLFLLLAIPFGMVVCSSITSDGPAVQLGWSMVWVFLLLVSPCLMGSLFATGYICRTLLFRPNAVAGMEE
jgi:hypothetical protein